jgi:Tol biopolymer transport system component
MNATTSRRLILTFVISIAVYAMACFSPISWAPDGSSIAFVITRPEKAGDANEKGPSPSVYELLTWNLKEDKGKVLDALPERQGTMGAPAFSPDGGKIAYLRGTKVEGTTAKTPRSKLSLRFIDPRAGNSSEAWTTEVPQEADKVLAFFGYPLSWSPDGQALVFQIEEDAYLFNQATGKAALLRKKLLCPTWSPRGAQIAGFDCPKPAESNEGRIILVSPEGNEIKSLAGVPVQMMPDSPRQGPAWRPDGQALAYTTVGKGQDKVSTLSVIDLNGNAKELLQDKENLVCPTWSPDGKQIAFLSWVQENKTKAGDSSQDVVPTKAKVFDLATNSVRTILDGKPLALVLFAPAWSPDGKSIAVFGLSKNTGTVLILSPDGQVVKRLPK